MRRSQSRYWRQQKEILAPRPSSSAKYSGVITPRKKLLGSVKKLFEKITLTYLLGIPKLEGDTTRKTATRGAPKMVTRSALSVRHGYHATGTRLPAAHSWCAR
jgi:hypothetical protein